MLENIVVNRQYEPLPLRLIDCLPRNLAKELEGMDGIEELHLSYERCSFVKAGGEYVPISFRISAKMFADILDKMCGSSLYAHAETMRMGYISLGEGIRVGLAGRAVVEGEQVCGICDIRAMLVRIPRTVFPDVESALGLLEHYRFTRGLLIYAPPGGGKTSFLRACALALSSGRSPKRTVIVDTRDELGYSLGGRGLCLDILSGYPKAYGMELAMRVLSPEILICDEIGGEREKQAISELSSGGVPLLASVHASTLSELLTRPFFADLHRRGVFGGYLLPRRDAEPLVTEWEAANAYL